VANGNNNPEHGTGNSDLAVVGQDDSAQPVPAALQPPPQPNAVDSQQSIPAVPTEETTQGLKAKPTETLAFIVNLTFLVASGTWLCVWQLYYTDNFDDFAKVLALGGGLTWLAFLLKLLPDERLKALQVQLDRLVFSQWWLTAALIIAFAVGLYTRAHIGTLQVELFQGNEERVLTVKGAGVPLDQWRLMREIRSEFQSGPRSASPRFFMQKSVVFPIYESALLRTSAEPCASRRPSLAAWSCSNRHQD
jgi:hypothetical protein